MHNQDPRHSSHHIHLRSQTAYLRDSLDHHFGFFVHVNDGSWVRSPQSVALSPLLRRLLFTSFKDQRTYVENCSQPHGPWPSLHHWQKHLLRSASTAPRLVGYKVARQRGRHSL
jgi:hypothetical protein